MAKGLISSLLIVSFSGAVVFGFVIMMDNGGGYGSCFATAMNGTTACPLGNNTLAFLAFHLNTFKSFATALMGENTALFLVFALSIILGMAGIFLLRKAFSKFEIFPLFFGRYLFSVQFVPLAKNQFIHWLALHENSPTHFLRREQ